MDFELCDLIMTLDSKDKMENLQQKITDFYTSNDFSVNDPNVTGGKIIDIEEHSTKDNKEVKLKLLAIYFYTKENKVMIPGSDINLEIFIENYLHQFTRSPGPDSYIPMTLLQQITNQNSLVMILTSLIAHKFILLMQMKFTRN